MVNKMFENKIMDINYGDKCIEVDILKIANRIRMSFGEPLVTVELHPATLEHMIKYVIENYMDNLKETVYKNAREEAKKMIYNVRSKYDGEKLLGGGKITNDLL